MVSHIEANRVKLNEGKYLKFPIVSHPRGPYNHHIIVRVDTGAEVNFMNKNTFKELFPEVKCSVHPHEIHNFGNLLADISALGQFCTYLQFRGEKYLNTFIVTDVNDCPNLLSHGATFRMGVLLPNYPRDMVVEGENVPHFNKMSGDKMGAHTSLSNVFQILGDIRKQQQAVQIQCENPELASLFRTTTSSENPAPITSISKQARPVHVQAFPVNNTSWSGPPAHSTHLPMGIVVTQNIFQSKLDAIFIGTKGVTGIADDMVIAGRDEMENGRNFLAFMEKCMKSNLTLNAKKIQFKQPQVSFHGHCWLKHGISSDPKKTEALNHVEFPLDKKTMRSFLGMVNYLNQYSALSAHLCAPLSVLTHQAVDHKPSKIHFENFNRLKVEVSSMGALPYFDVNAETTLQTDASKS